MLPFLYNIDDLNGKSAKSMPPSGIIIPERLMTTEGN